MISLAIIVAIFAVPIVLANVTFAQPMQDKTEITFWYTENDTEKPGVTALVTAFEAANPDIDVVASQKGFFNARNDYQSAYIAGEEPDVFRATRDWIPEFANSKMLKPITDIYTEEEWDEFLDLAVDLATYPDPDTGEEEIWAVCQLLDTPALMFNKHMFEQAGINTTELDLSTSWTWEEYWSALYAVNQTEGLYGTVLGGMFFGAQPYFFGHGGELFYNKSVKFENIAINSSSAREGLSFVKNLTSSSYTPRWEEQGWTNLNLYFIETGQVAMINQGPWELKNFLENSVEFNPNLEDAKEYASPENLGIMQLPQDEAGNRGAPVGGQWYVISRNTQGDKAQAAEKFVKYITSEEVMIDKAKEYYHIPPRPAVMESDELINNVTKTGIKPYQYVKGYYDAVLEAVTVPVDHRWASIEQRFADNLDEYLAGDLTLDETIQATRNEWRTIIPPEGAGGDQQGPQAAIPGLPLSLLVGSSLIGVIFIILKNMTKKHK
jgi:arabinogalactan oligomer/maltooligosaccharide transport system substrate-binding protein